MVREAVIYMITEIISSTVTYLTNSSLFKFYFSDNVASGKHCLHL